MQTLHQPWLLQSAPAHVQKKQLILIVAVFFVAVAFSITVRVTWVYFFARPAGPTIDLVGTWKQEQPLGDAAGSAGWNRWLYTFRPNGRFQVRAERKVTGKPWQAATIDSTGRWTFHNGKLVMTFDSDGKTETVMVTRFDNRTLAIDKGTTRTFMVREP